MTASIDRTGDLVRHYLDVVDVDAMMAHLATVARFDRFQASLGLNEAAATVADLAEAAGLDEVAIDHHPADGVARWWSFRAPVAWTPVVARLALTGSGALHLEQSADPYLVATYSAPTAGERELPLVRWSGDSAGLAGAVAVVDRPEYLRGDLQARLAAAGALGFVTDAPWRDDHGVERRGRIELDLHSPLFAFSLTPREFTQVAAGAQGSARVRVQVEVDRSATMPVVSAVLPGSEAGDEVWLMAHLCHPRPSANDNASGVAALLGVAQALCRTRAAGAWPGSRTVRFFWYPEFVGTAAVLHSRRDAGLPAAVVNLDMVGQDQLACAAPFVVERPPDSQPSVLGPLAEHVVGEVFARTARTPGSWQRSPLQGFSDHALFADPSIRRPAVQFCHPADRFNHSAADSVDKVSPMEMLRSAAAAAGLTQWCSDETLSPGIAAVVDRWCRADEAAAAAVARRHDPVWGAGLVAHVAAVNAGIRRAAGLRVPDRSPPPTAGRGPGLSVAWSGPLNLRGMQAALPADTRARLAELIARDKSCLSALFNIAIRADGRLTAGELVERASYAARLPIDPRVGRILTDALVESGWIAAPATS
jgi:hypothetical protein